MVTTARSPRSTDLGKPSSPADGPAEVASASSSTIERVESFLRRVPFYPVALAAYPVLLLYSDNVVDVEAGDVVVPLLVVVAATAVGLAILSLLWHEPRRAAVLTTAFVLPFLGFGLAAELVAPLWPFEPIVRSYLMVLLIWVVVLSVAFYVASRLQGRLGTLTEALNVVSVILLVLTLVPIVGFASASREPGVPPAGAEAALLVTTDTDRSAGSRDIYHLVFDRYGSDAALLSGHGIDNSGFTDWLRAHGFQVVDDARANYERTALSLSSVHDMSLHDDLVAAMGPGSPDIGPLYERISHSAAASLLQRHGYRYFHVGSWFQPTADSAIADHVERPTFEISFVSTLIDRSAITGLDALLTMATTLSAHGTTDRQAAVTEAQFEALGALRDEPGPKYVFAHVLVPHEPYLFLADGTFDPHGADFESQLAYANAQIKALVEPLLALPPEDQPVIILQADEGPYPERYALARDHFDWSTATDEELATKFGVLDAMYLPGPEGQAALPAGMSLVNTYPEVLDRYLDVDVPHLPDRSYTLVDGAPYHQTDVTERLDAALRAIAGDRAGAAQPSDQVAPALD